MNPWYGSRGQVNDDIVAAARATIRDEFTRHGTAEHVAVEIREYDAIPEVVTLLRRT